MILKETLSFLPLSNPVLQYGAYIRFIVNIIMFNLCRKSYELSMFDTVELPVLSIFTYTRWRFGRRSSVPLAECNCCLRWGSSCCNQIERVNRVFTEFLTARVYSEHDHEVTLIDVTANRNILLHLKSICVRFKFLIPSPSNQQDLHDYVQTTALVTAVENHRSSLGVVFFLCWLEFKPTTVNIEI